MFFLSKFLVWDSVALAAGAVVACSMLLCLILNCVKTKKDGRDGKTVRACQIMRRGNRYTKNHNGYGIVYRDHGHEGGGHGASGAELTYHMQDGGWSRGHSNGS